MKKKIFSFIYFGGLLFVIVIGGFIYSYYPLKFIHDGYNMYEAKQKTYFIMAIFWAIILAIYYLFRLFGINKCFEKKSKNYDHEDTGKPGMDRRNITFFLLGFQRIFIHIRSQIQRPYNINLLEKISRYALLLNESDIGYDMFKAEILKIADTDAQLEEFFKTALNNFNISFETDNLQEIRSYLYVISDTSAEICMQLDNGNLDRAWDLVDAIHCLPEALLSKKDWNPKSFWDTYIRPYREKWDGNFLNVREKELENR